MKRVLSIALLAGLSALGACQTDTESAVTPNAGTASIGRSGGNAPAAGPGGLLGAWAGSGVGAAMSEADRAHNREAENRASHAPIGQMVTWNNPADGNSGTIVAMHDGYSPSGAYCREYRQSVTIAGQQRQGQVKACQQADGGWKAAQ